MNSKTGRGEIIIALLELVLAVMKGVKKLNNSFKKKKEKPNDDTS